MALVVQKYGGSSVGDIDRIRHVAERVVRTKEAGNDVIVVVSAMGETTDDLLAKAQELTPLPEPREMDLLLTAGERISMSLLAIAVNALGHKAESYTGSQAGIITSTEYGKAKIVDVRPGRIREAIDEGNIVIVAGFQGVSTTYDVTTLGRGGSDTTAVALAAAVGADYCEIYTDVEGVFTADPRLVPDARKLDAVSFEEMLELASSGAKVLQLRSVEYARRQNVPLVVRSSFSDEPGTWIKEGTDMEEAIISGVAHDEGEAKVTIVNVPDKPGMASQIFRAIADEGINVDMIVQNVSHDKRTDMSFTVPLADLARFQVLAESLVPKIGAESFSVDEGIAKISLVGAGMKSHPGVAADMFDTLAEQSINIEMISTSSIRISCVIRASDTAKAVQAIHAKFNLSGSEEVPA